MTVRRIWAAVALVLVLAAIVLAVDSRDRPLSERPDRAGLPRPGRVLRLVRDPPSRCGTDRRPGRRCAVRRRRDRAGDRREPRARGRAGRGGFVVAARGRTREAFKVHATLPRAERPSRPVLFYNPLSGGGKAERFHLADEARRRGIEPIELTPRRGPRATGARRGERRRRRAGDGRRRRVAGDRRDDRRGARPARTRAYRRAPATISRSTSGSIGTTSSERSTRS